MHAAQEFLLSTYYTPLLITISMMATKKNRVATSRPSFRFALAAAAIAATLPYLCVGHISTAEVETRTNNIDLNNAIIQKISAPIPVTQQRRRIESKTGKSKSGKFPTTTATNTESEHPVDIGDTETHHHGSKSSKVSKHNIWEGYADEDDESYLYDAAVTTSSPQSSTTSSSISPTSLVLPIFDFSSQPSSFPSSSPQPTSSNPPSSTPTMTAYPSISPMPSSSASPTINRFGEQPFLSSIQETSPPTTSFQLENASSTPLLPPTTDSTPTTTESTDGNDVIINNGGQVDREPTTSSGTVMYGMISLAVASTSALIFLVIG